jgi:hypothetical protein
VSLYLYGKILSNQTNVTVIIQFNYVDVHCGFFYKICATINITDAATTTSL